MPAPRVLLVTDLARTRLPLLELAAEAVAGGVDAIYLRHLTPEDNWDGILSQIRERVPPEVLLMVPGEPPPALPPGVRVAGGGLSTNGGSIAVTGSSAGGVGVQLGDGGAFAIDSNGGAISIDGTGVTAGVSMQGNTVDSGGGAIDVAGIASGAGAIGVDLTDARLIGTSGDVTVLGNAAAGTGVNFAGQSGISTTTGGIGVTGIGATVGLALTGGELSTDSGHFDLRGRGTGAASDGLVIGQGISIATNGGGIELSGEGGSGAGISLAAGSSVDAGNSLVVIRAGNDGSSDAIRIGGTIASSMAVNLRPGGVDANGGLTERTADAILLGGGTAGFALSGAELALIDTPQLVIGSNLHAGAIQVLGGIARAGNLTLQNDGGSGGIDIQAAVDVGNGTLALSSGGDITQGSSGAITAHSLLARAGGDVLLADANNNVAANTLAGSAGGDFEYQDVDALAIGSVSALGMNAGANGLASIGATGIAAGGNVFVRNLAGDMTLNAGVSGVNIDLVTANTLQNPAGASLLASGDWRVWANTWVGETRGGLAGDGNLPNLYGCAFLGQCGVTVPGIDNHFIYVQQPTALISFDNFTREYGLPNPVFTFTVTGAILGDSGANVASGTGTTTATIGSNVGNYAITGNFSSAAGYRIQFVPGTLAITPATLLFTADPFVRYLGTENPLFTGTVTGFRNGDTVQSVFGDGIVWNSPAGLLSPIGFYPINGGTSAINYVFAQAPGNATALQIIPLPQLSSTPIDLIRETVNTYVYDRNFGGAPMCALNASLEDQQLASTGDELSNEWSKVRSRPNLTNCFETERKNGCGEPVCLLLNLSCFRRRLWRAKPSVQGQVANLVQDCEPLSVAGHVRSLATDSDIGQAIETPGGPGVVISLHLLKELVTVRLDDEAGETTFRSDELGLQASPAPAPAPAPRPEPVMVVEPPVLSPEAEILEAIVPAVPSEPAPAKRRRRRRGSKRGSGGTQS